MSICSLIGVPLAISVTSPMKKPIIATRPFTFSAYGVKPCGPRYSLSSLAARLSSSAVKELFFGLCFVSSAMRNAAGWAGGRVLVIDGVKDETVVMSGAKVETNAVDETISQDRACGDVLRVQDG